MANQTNLSEEITGNLVQCQINDKYFLPRNHFSQIFSPENIKAALPGATPDLVDFVLEKATKVFATVIKASRKSGQDLVEIMNPFRISNFDDTRLYRGKERPKCGWKSRTKKCTHDLVFNILHGDLWDGPSVHSFFEDRWAFNAPVFCATQLRHDCLSSKVILPFVLDDENEDDHDGRRGGFSKVTKVTIHPHHQDMILRNEHGLDVALKELRSSPDYAEVRTAWEMELDALTMTNELNSKNLNKLIAGVNTGDSYYLILEWANGKSLQDFWENTEPDLTPKLIADVLEQLHGIADALESLHTKAEITGVRTDGSGNWRHGDLKPDNILRTNCTEDSTDLGTLQIADLGLAKHHTVSTGERDGPTSMRHGSVAYEAPEGHPAARVHSPRSRRYDCWSMGCIILEFIIWLLSGNEGLKGFRNETSKATSDEERETSFFATNFYKCSKGKFMVNDIAKEWMRRMRRDPELQEGKETALNDLLNLVSTRLLVVDTEETRTIAPEPETGKPKQPRAKASELKESLAEMVKKGKDQERPHYLLGALDRIGVRKLTSISNEGLAPPKPHGLGIARGLPQNSDPFTEVHIATLASHNTQYKHELDDIWRFIVDNDFAVKAVDIIGPTGRDLPQQITSALCERCSRLDFSRDNIQFTDNMDMLSNMAQGCDFCRLVHRACNRVEITEAVQLRRQGSSIMVENRGSPILSICRGREIAESLRSVQVGFPSLPLEGSETRFKLINHWLEDCDEHHQCYSKEPRKLPKRVIEVGSETDQAIRLWETHDSNGRYVALSHRWGDRTKHQFSSTTTLNVKNRTAGMQASDLPQSFQDAIKVTRKLGIPYLWIDSLCIIQGDGGDWEDQSKCMEEIFSFAYCVVAATQASGTADGFLEPPTPRDFVTFSDGSNNHLYVSQSVNDFDQHITRAGLNKRGWVYQERALARRTIHFAKEQAYWECGHGIRCETLTRMHNSTAALFGDPNFPLVAKQESMGGLIVFFETFYRNYSALELSFPADRPVAIAGLESRLIRALGVHGGYGILDSRQPGYGSFLGRSLLWKRREDVKSMEKIRFSPGSEVPSWSWMSYEGAIDYLEVPFNMVNWADDIRSPWDQKISEQSSWQTADRSANNELVATCRGFAEPSTHNICYDGGSRPAGQELKCVVIGRQKDDETMEARKCYVLIIAKRAEIGWERVGVAELLEKDIVFGQADVSVRIS